MTAEHQRLAVNAGNKVPLEQWGPYLSERQWGTVREDYGPYGDAWNYFPFEQAHYRSYIWGEDGLAGISDYFQNLCFAVALWNGKDELLKERLFGLGNSQGNHGEDVKELYYYLDNTPTHSYMEYLYKYPQKEFPYKKIYEENQKRSKLEPEYEILDTGIFDNNQYFDVSVTYAKQNSQDIFIRIVIQNRYTKTAPIMNEKGLVKRDASVKTHIYQAAVSREKTQKHLLGKMIDGLFGGSSTQLVIQALGNHKASNEELESIQNLLNDLKNQ